jgi:hypothetical protein
MEKITAKLMHRADHQKLWLVSWPSTLRKQGKAYLAFTDPYGSLIRIVTAAHKRQVSATVANKIAPAVQQAIAEAKAIA